MQYCSSIADVLITAFHSFLVSAEFKKQNIFIFPYSSSIIIIPPHFTMSASRLSIATKTKFYSTLLWAYFLFLLNSSPIIDLPLTRRYETSANDYAKELNVKFWLENSRGKTSYKTQTLIDGIILKRILQKRDAKRILVTLAQNSDSLNRVNTDWTAVLRLLGNEIGHITLNQALIPTQPSNRVSSIPDSQATRTQTYHSHPFSAKVRSSFLKEYV